MTPIFLYTEENPIIYIYLVESSGLKIVLLDVNPWNQYYSCPWAMWYLLVVSALHSHFSTMYFGTNYTGKIVGII